MFVCVYVYVCVCVWNGLNSCVRESTCVCVCLCPVGECVCVCVWMCVCACPDCVGVNVCVRVLVCVLVCGLLFVCLAPPFLWFSYSLTQHWEQTTITSKQNTSERQKTSPPLPWGGWLRAHALGENPEGVPRDTPAGHTTTKQRTGAPPKTRRRREQKTVA